MSSSSGSKPVDIRDDVLDDLATRFLINIPDEDKDDPLKLCSHIELAHWFYLDLMRPDDSSLPGCSMKEFMATIFKHCPFLVRDSVAKDLDTLQSQWKTHKYSRPTRGAIILNHNLTKCLLVQGYPASTSWGFPKGKQESGESDEDCSIREVYEETGFDIRELIQSEHYLELPQPRESERTCRLYIVPGVPENTVFKPRVRKEIRDIQWFKVDDLPRHKKDLTTRQNLRKNPSNFFMIIPFINQLKKWILSYQKSHYIAAKKSSRSVSASFTSPSPSSLQQPPPGFSSSSSSSNYRWPSAPSTAQRQRPPLLPQPHPNSNHHNQSLPTRAVSGPVLGPGSHQITGTAPHGVVTSPHIRPGLERAYKQPPGGPLRSYSIPNPVSVPYRGPRQSDVHYSHINPQLHYQQLQTHAMWQAHNYSRHHLQQSPLLPPPHLPFSPSRPPNYPPHPTAFNPVQSSAFNPLPTSPSNTLPKSAAVNSSAFNPVKPKKTGEFNPFAALGISTVHLSESTKVGMQASSIPNHQNRNGNMRMYRPVQVQLKPSRSMCEFKFDKSLLMANM